MFQLLILARHGRTAWNLDGRYQGQGDPPLSVVGRLDALTLADQLRSTRITRVLTSPLQRAVQTAAIVAERLDVAAVVRDDRLVEIDYGAWEGLTQAEIKAGRPDEMRAWKQSPETMRFPGGETLAELRARLLSFLTDDTLWSACVEAQAVGSATLVISHSGPIRIAELEAIGASLRDFRRIAVKPGSLRSYVLHVKHGRSILPSTCIRNFLCKAN